MLRKCLSLVLAGLLFQTTCAAAAVSARARAGGGGEDAKLAQKVKAGIYESGTVPEPRIKVKPRDKTTLEGYVESITKDSSVIAGAKTGAAMTVAYSEVKQVKGNNFSTGAKIGIGAAIAAGIAVIIVLATRGGGRGDSGPIRCGGVTTPCP
ncbi:MAG TPA: hypothetical protein VN256_25385 [Pyrinomonadaceae bacterium]|nr:hypothetical protein [Pyrinomonadaceae bacterium]